MAGPHLRTHERTIVRLHPFRPDQTVLACRRPLSSHFLDGVPHPLGFSNRLLPHVAPLSLHPRHSELSTVVEKDRNGELADINTAQAVLESYIKLVVMPDVPNPDPVVQLRVYADEFEKVFLEQTRDFYQRETNHLVQTLSCTEYLEKAHQRLDEEALRAKKLLHRSSDEKLRELCEKCVIIDHRDMIERHCKVTLTWASDYGRAASALLVRRIPQAYALERDEFGAWLDFISSADRCSAAMSLDPTAFFSGVYRGAERDVFKINVQPASADQAGAREHPGHPGGPHHGPGQQACRDAQPEDVADAPEPVRRHDDRALYHVPDADPRGVF